MNITSRRAAEFALALLAISTEIPAQTQTPNLRLEPYTFVTVTGDSVPAERGYLSVPENRRRANSRRITLGFVRFRSVSPNPGPPIVYLAGGPGGSGTSAAFGSRFKMFMALREIADVIAFDPRGVHTSDPSLECPYWIDFPLDREPTRAALLATYQARSRACAAHWRAKGVDLFGYNTNESADDLEDLRKALGALKLSLVGISYGTHLAFATIRRHPTSIHRAVLAGTEGPSHTIKLPSNIQLQLEEIDRLVTADTALSRKIPDFLGLVSTVLQRLEKRPVEVETQVPTTRRLSNYLLLREVTGKATLAERDSIDAWRRESKENDRLYRMYAPVLGFPVRELASSATLPATPPPVTRRVIINKFIVQNLAANALGGPQIRNLPANFLAMSRGDYSAIAKQWVDEARGSLGSAMSYMMDCASGVSRQRRAQIAVEARKTLLGDAVNFPFPEACDAWGSPDLGDAFRARLRSDVPAFFISGTLDARTPPSQAEEVRKGFSSSAHLVLEHQVHSDPLFLSSPRILDRMMAFLRGEKVDDELVRLPPPRFVIQQGFGGSSVASAVRWSPYLRNLCNRSLQCHFVKAGALARRIIPIRHI